MGRILNKTGGRGGGYANLHASWPAARVEWKIGNELVCSFAQKRHAPDGRARFSIIIINPLHWQLAPTKRTRAHLPNNFRFPSATAAAGQLSLFPPALGKKRIGR